MRFIAPIGAWFVTALDLNRNLTLNPFAPESKIKMKIMIKRGTV